MIHGQLVEKHCRKCGKIFIPAPLHIYKDGKGIYCSWTCYNHRNEGLMRKPYTSRTVLQFTEGGELVRAYKDAVKAAEAMGGRADSIRKACHEKSVYKGFIWRYGEEVHNEGYTPTEIDGQSEKSS